MESFYWIVLLPLLQYDHSHLTPQNPIRRYRPPATERNPKTVVLPAMDGRDHNMNVTAPPPMEAMHNHRMMMHMSFFWGKNGEILFHHWPGNRTGMYVIALILVFFLSFLLEWLHRCKFLKPDSDDVVSGLVRTLVHGLRVVLGYMLMLALMCFNGGVFLTAVFGHCLGFFLFGSRVFKRWNDHEKSSDLSHSFC